MIIFDDSARAGYREGLDYLAAQGFKRLDFDGLKPNVLPTSRMSICYRVQNGFGL